MRKIAASVVTLALASSARAAVVTYYLSLHEGSNGLVTATNNYAVYASVSQGDNAGLFAYAVDLKGTGDAGGPTTLTIVQRTPNGTWDIDDADPNYDGLDYPTKFAGFGAGRTALGTTGIVSAFQDLNKGEDLVRVYGYGQPPPHKMDEYRPPPALGQLGPIPYKPYVGSTATDGGGAGGQNPYGNPVTVSGGGGGGCGGPGGFFTLPAGSLRIATGTWMGTAPSIEQLSPNTKANVWKLDHPNGTENESAQIQFAVRDLIIIDCFDFVRLNGLTSGTNQAVGGAISVSGANNSYVSEVDQLLDPSVSIGNAPIQTIGDESGNIYVMAKLNGTAADIAAVLGNLTADVDATDSQFAALHIAYDSRFAGGTFNALFKFPNTAGVKTFNWELVGPHGTVTVDQIAVVPEPNVAFWAMGGVMLLKRRRR